ncbi:MAG: response regulator transcription factor [Elusimicrobiota bacterium]
MKKKILIISSDSNTVKSLQEILYNVKDEVTFLITSKGEQGIDMAWKDNPNIVIADRVLTDFNAVDLLGILKKNIPTQSIPVVILSSKDDYNYEDEVKAFTMGVEDYLIKPVFPATFNARIEAIIQRYSHIQKDDIELQSGEITINMETRVAFVSNKEITLTPKEFSLLYLFLKKKNKVLTRMYLSESVWEQQYYKTSQTIDRHVANLRKKLGKEGKRIDTVPTVGYMFKE